MTNIQHELFSKLLKLKPPVFKGAEFEDAYDFLVDCHELLHKMGIVKMIWRRVCDLSISRERQNVVAVTC